MSRLFALAALPLVACLTGSTATGGDPLDNGDREHPATGAAPASIATADGHSIPDRIYDPPLGKLIYAAQIQCAGDTAFVDVATAVPADELELRRAPEIKVGEFGRVYTQRTSYLFDALLKAPNAIGYPYRAMLPLDGQSCEDFTAQLQEVRGRFGEKSESHAVQPAPAQTQP